MRRAHSEKEEDIKNSDQNGPEGQFKATGSTVCNAGLLLWRPGFMILGRLIKVSMKKKKEKRRKSSAGAPESYSQGRLVCARLQIFKFAGACT